MIHNSSHLYNFQFRKHKIICWSQTWSAQSWSFAITDSFCKFSQSKFLWKLNPFSTDAFPWEHTKISRMTIHNSGYSSDNPCFQKKASKGDHCENVEIILHVFDKIFRIWWIRAEARNEWCYCIKVVLQNLSCSAKTVNITRIQFTTLIPCSYENEHESEIGKMDISAQNIRCWQNFIISHKRLPFFRNSDI